MAPQGLKLRKAMPGPRARSRPPGTECSAAVWKIGFRFRVRLRYRTAHLKTPVLACVYRVHINSHEQLSRENAVS